MTIFEIPFWTKLGKTDIATNNNYFFLFSDYSYFDYKSFIKFWLNKSKELLRYLDINNEEFVSNVSGNSE